VVLPSGILQATAQPEAQDREVDKEPGQGGEPVGPAAEAPKDELRPSRVRRRKTVAERTEKLEGRRLYLSEGVFLRLRLYAMTKKLKLSEAAEELLDRNLPTWDLRRVS
jgi:hypothetical protein